MRNNRLIFLFILPAMLSLPLQGQDTNQNRVKYIAAEHVYITAGREHGIVIGDTLTVVQNNTPIARLRVTYAAARTASCKIERQTKPIKAGDYVSWIKKSNIHAGMTKKPPLIQRKRTPVITSRFQSTRRTRTTRGSISLQYFQFNETRFNTGITQPSLRLRLYTDNLASTGLNFRFKLRSRMNRRNYRFSDSPKTEWRNRLYEISLSNSEEKSFHFMAGRIISRRFSGVGYIDGIQIQQRIRGNFSVGLFGGVQPRWQFMESSPTLNKYGAYIHYQTAADPKKNQLQWTVAGAGVYQGSTISREFIYIQSSFSSQNNWRIYQSLELDINRRWRKDRVGEELSLTGLYLSAYGRLHRNLSLNISLDNRKNYYTYAWISLADSLFDSAFRRGARTSLQWKVNSFLRLYLNAGLRRTDGINRDTYSFSGHAVIRNRPWRGFLTNLRYSRFENPFTSGRYIVFRMGQNLRHGHAVFLDYGRNDYTYQLTGSSKLNHWIRLDLQILPSRRFFLNLNGELDWGDDLKGQRLYANLGFRF